MREVSDLILSINPLPLPRNKPVLIYWLDKDGKEAIVRMVGM